MQRTALIALAFSMLTAAAAPALASGTTTSENTCKRGWVYDAQAKKCVKR